MHIQRQRDKAFALVREYGPPDAFLKITVNRNWEEFADMDPYESVWETARIFQSRVQHFLDQIKQGHVYGATKCYARSIEFQW